MNNFGKSGSKQMTFTAPTGGVLSGVGYVVGALFVVATNTIAQTLPFEGCTEGVFALPKAAGSAWTEGALLYWDGAGNNLVTAASVTARRVGNASAAALTADVTGQVRLCGVPTPVNVA